VALLGNLTGSSQFFNNAAFYNDVATQSLRFDQSSSARLEKTPNASNRITWTWSAWVKRSKLGDERAIWSVGSSSKFALFFHHLTHQLRVWSHNGEGSIYTNRVFRDLSAWYHICLTSKNSGNYYELYVNGVKETSFSLDQRSSYPGGNEHEVNSNDVHYIGAWNNGGLQYFDGYLADVNFIDGTCVGDTNGILDELGELKNGVWIPKKYTGSYGTNGYRLEFKQTGVGTASTTTIGADTSGNTNHYTSSGIVASDCAMPDSPENNFATFNGVYNLTGGSLSEGTLKVATGSSQYGPALSTFAQSSGKWYAEFAFTSTSGDTRIGGVRVDTALSTTYDIGNSGSFAYRQNDGDKKIDGTETSYGATWSASDIIGIALNLDDNEVTFYKNNASQGTFSITGGEYFIALSDGDSGAGGNYLVNFGQDSSFAGNKTAQGNTDGNGIGDFYYAPPTGFLALCTSNLPEPTISPNADTQADDYFNTLIYDGNDDATRTFDVGFVSDWSWFKARNGSGYGHQLYDSSRGVTKRLFSNTTAAESTNAEGVIDFDDSGTLLKIGTDAFLNEDGTTMVIWNWKANGGTTTTNDASATSIGSQDSVYQANTTAGFSIVTYTGTGANDTFAHGLGVAPRYIIFKKRASGTQNWVVYHEDVGNNRQLFLNLTNAQTGTNSVYFNNTSPTTTVFTLGSDDYANADGGTYVAYCFADVEGYSKFGSYTGNGSTDGTFVYTGFRPAWVMFKKTSATDDWVIIDSTRDVDNVASQTLYANGNFAEDSNVTNRSVDFLSNGFKLRSSGTYINLSSGTFIYMAFAEAPFKYANAR